MIKINSSELNAAFQAFIGKEVYIHSEATSFVFVRNFKVSLIEAHIAGEGSYRIALRFDELGWLRTEALTHYELTVDGKLLLAGYDDKGRMNVALQLGKEPFPE
ncbi:hypothetical protein BK120_13695 [Paenibacillus sp. FSL A5-0031]|uniref:DUF1806 family protein n=1 Tax=Paenibacillus sp. FSL A5-0031 TaxID=1920420 RepID=UPI00096EE8FC|nr:DUF1806 family protein [Paenibacillus sp. FSL A5-0031]OME84147.1 hypothetical protein BK120_13695 [Paenibacillus sp. FSL A5-0031]